MFYGYLLYTPVLHDWFYHPAVHDVEKTDFFVKELPFPAITICSNNKIVKRQLESVLLTEPWKGYNKKIANFAQDFESALTSLVLAQEYPQSLSNLNQGSIDILNQHKDALPDVMTKVNINIRAGSSTIPPIIKLTTVSTSLRDAAQVGDAFI